ncbi:MAG: hypothetical protein Q9211_000640 [Gyalolechia sp. 1 TL-2023]
MPPDSPIIDQSPSSSSTPPQLALTLPTDPQWVAGRLRAYRLYQNDLAAFARYPGFEKHIKEILYGKRSSSVNPVDFQEFQLVWDEYKDYNKDTILAELLPFFMKKKRTVLIEGTAEEEDVHTMVSFLKSGLVEISKGEFHRTCLPFQDDSTVDKELIDALAKVNGMMNPKPDRTFGISVTKHWFPVEGFPIPPEIAIWLEVMQGIHHAFFIMEGKSFEGNMRDAWNQVSRGGATLNSMARRVMAILGWPDILGADTRTFVFSATLSPG